MKRKRIKTQSVVYPVGKRQIPGLQSIKTNDIFNFGCNVTTKCKWIKNLPLSKSFKKKKKVALECRFHYATFQYFRSSVKRDILYVCDSIKILANVPLSQEVLQNCDESEELLSWDLSPDELGRKEDIWAQSPVTPESLPTQAAARFVIPYLYQQ